MAIGHFRGETNFLNGKLQPPRNRFLSVLGEAGKRVDFRATTVANGTVAVRGDRRNFEREAKASRQRGNPKATALLNGIRVPDACRGRRTQRQSPAEREAAKAAERAERDAQDELGKRLHVMPKGSPIPIVLREGRPEERPKGRLTERRSRSATKADLPRVHHLPRKRPKGRFRFCGHRHSDRTRLTLR